MSTASDVGHETAGIGLEVPGGGMLHGAPRRQTTLRALPRPFIFMAYFSVFVLSCMAITLAVVYGSTFQSATSTAWGISTATSIIFEYVLVEPIWLMVTAFIQVRMHLLKTVENELAGNRVHHHDDEPDAARAEEAVRDSQQNSAAEPGFDSLATVMEGDAIDSIELHAIDLIPGKLEDILADRIGSFVYGLRAPNASSMYNFVRDVDESEFRRACSSCGLDTKDERITDLWGSLELDGRSRAQVRAIIDKLTLNNLDKHIATLFLKMDVVDEPYTGVNGEYRRSDKMCNGRPVYIKESKQSIAMWWANSEGKLSWCVGPKESVGGRGMWAYVESEGFGPEEAGQRAWSVYSYDSRAWEEQVGVRVENLDPPEVEVIQSRAKPVPSRVRISGVVLRHGGAARGEEVQRLLGGFMEDRQVVQIVPEGSALLTFGELRSRFNALLDAEDSANMEIEEDRDDILRMLETQLSTVLSRMDARGARRQVLLPKQRPYVVSNVADLDEIQLTGPAGGSAPRAYEPDTGLTGPTALISRD